MWQKFSREDGLDVLSALESSREGLCPEVVGRRLLENGQNIAARPASFWRTVLRRKMRSSFLYLLLVASGLSFVLGDHVGAALIFLFLVINTSLETYQEYRSEKAVQLLRRYLVTSVRVRRDGNVLSIESKNVVSGDIILVEAGDRLPADMRFLETQGVEVDESVMTGESVAVRKTEKILATPPTDMYQATNIGFAGTAVTAGHGEGVVFTTGTETALGDIAQLTGETERETIFEKGISRFSAFLVKLVVFTIVLIFLANLIIKQGSLNSIELFIFSLVLIVSVIPEALPVILTVALSRGSLRLAQKKVVVKRLSAIEDLGSIEVLCTDKTGTLTENALAISDIKAADSRGCLRLAFAACLEVPTEREQLHDAFDIGLWRALSEKERLTVGRMKRLDNIPFDPERRRNSVLVETGVIREVIVRGAPEEVFKLSKNISAFALKDLMQWIEAAGRTGARVLAVARKPFDVGRQYSLYEEQHLEFVGLIAFTDTVKETARRTIDQARALNVDVKILTGDSREVAGAVGYAVGLIEKPEAVVTGRELEELDYEERRELIFSQSVFARVSPRQKFEIIKMLQEKREVGFLGDGINDAPALKLANVALVVSGASDIAREAADIVLLQKNLSVVVDGIKEGRLIFANILKYLRVTLTSNFGNFYSVALASLFLPFVPLLPIQMLLMDLLSDFPMIAIATDTVDVEELEQPKNYNIHSIVLMAILLGAVSSVFDFILFGVFYKVSAEALQTAWFILSAFTEIELIFSLRTKRAFFQARRAPFLLIAFSVAVLGIVLFLPFTDFGVNVLHFVRPTFSFLLVPLSLAVAYFFANEAIKRFYFRHMRDHQVACLAREKHRPFVARV